jgi:hypothetical protein
MIEPRVSTRVNYWGATLLTKVRGRASGRPGPRFITGDYRRSWTGQPTRSGGGAAFEVGTGAVQGPRLEYGFSGTDSLGRNYNQPPFPHVRPATDEIQGPFEADIEATIGKLL